MSLNKIVENRASLFRNSIMNFYFSKNSFLSIYFSKHCKPLDLILLHLDLLECQTEYVVHEWYNGGICTTKLHYTSVSLFVSILGLKLTELLDWESRFTTTASSVTQFKFFELRFMVSNTLGQIPKQMRPTNS